LVSRSRKLASTSYLTSSGIVWYIEEKHELGSAGLYPETQGDTAQSQ